MTVALEGGFERRRRLFRPSLSRQEAREHGIGLGRLVDEKLFDVCARALVSRIRQCFGERCQLGRVVRIAVLREPERDRLVRVSLDELGLCVETRLLLLVQVVGQVIGFFFSDEKARPLLVDAAPIDLAAERSGAVLEAPPGELANLLTR